MLHGPGRLAAAGGVLQRTIPFLTRDVVWLETDMPSCLPGQRGGPVHSEVSGGPPQPGGGARDAPTRHANRSNSTTSPLLVGANAW